MTIFGLRAVAAARATAPLAAAWLRSAADGCRAVFLAVAVVGVVAATALAAVRPGAAVGS